MLLVPWGRVLRRALVLTAVVVATLAGAYGALATVQTESTLSVGTVRFDVDPGHRGALDIYAPLVDWGVRFRGVRLPVRLKVDVRSVDRDAVVRVAQAGNLDVAAVREEATDAVRNFLIVLLVAILVVGFALGALVALAARPYSPLRLRVTLPVAAGTALLTTLLVAFLLPPSLSTNPKPQYYANGPDIPRALQALQTLRLSATRLDDELDTQLVGLARLVSDPASRQPLDGLPRLTVASDLHTNVLAIPALERAVNRGPLFFVGDMSDSGSPLEADLVGRIAHAGRPFVYVAGNHDSDTLDRRLARAGAVVLTRRGRLMADGSYGPIVVKEAGLRVAGYDDPLERQSDEGYRDHGGTPSVQDQVGVPGVVPSRPRPGRRDHGPQPGGRPARVRRAARRPAHDDAARLLRRPHAPRAPRSHRVRDRHQRGHRRRRRGGERRGRLADRDRGDDLPDQAGVLTTGGRPRADRSGDGLGDGEPHAARHRADGGGERRRRRGSS